MSTGYQLNTSRDYRYVANRETVTLLNAAGATVCTVVDAKRLMQGLAERAPSDGQYLYVPIDWRLPAVNTTQAVQPGWIIKDAANVAYVVQEVDPPGTYQGTYNCACLSLMALGRTITWTLPIDSTDSYSSPLTAETSTVGPLSAAIKEIACETIVFQGITQGFKRTYSIWFAGDITLSEGSLGIDDAGNNYVVTRVYDRLRIDELIQVECEVRP